MTAELTVRAKTHFRVAGHGHRVLKVGDGPPAPVRCARIPRVTRLLALAHRFDQLILDGVVRDYADLARLGHVTRARVSQIMDLLLLAPDIQQEILRLPAVETGGDPIHERQLREIVAVLDWVKQRQMWAHGNGFRVILQQQITGGSIP